MTAAALSGELSFATAEGALEQARRAVAGGATSVDLAGVTRTDSAGLALLLELKREARARQHDLAFANPPAQVRSLAAFFGVAEVLGLSA